MEWRDASDGRVSAWASEDGRFRIEKHPFADKYMLTDGGAFVDIKPTLAAAQALTGTEKP